jgi:3-hydroxybutyryl-CoA dehydratase
MEFKDFYVGQEYREKQLVTAERIDKFAETSGDKNLVHLDEEFAAKTPFKKRIAHGIFGLSLISAALGMRFPGIGTIYMKQDAKFVKPIYIGEEVEIVITVEEIFEEKKRLRLKTLVLNENGTVTIDGEALVMYNTEMFIQG